MGAKNQHPLISRQNRLKAIEEGKLVYESGTQCKHCETYQKYVKNSQCVSCLKLKTSTRNPEVYSKYIKSDKGQEWLSGYRKTEVYRSTQNRYRRKDYQYNKNWYVNNNLKQNYGLTLEEYNEMLKKQEEKCFICFDSSPNKNLSVDHDHATGAVRKLLCHKCNTALGLLKEDTDIMLRMIDYIKEHK